MGLFTKSIGPVFLKSSNRANDYIDKLKGLEDKCTGPLKEDVEKQKYITITIHGPSESPFVLIPNAYKALLTHMKTNGIREKRDSSVLACYEYEYVDAAGIECMDIFIAIE